MIIRVQGAEGSRILVEEPQKRILNNEQGIMNFEGKKKTSILDLSAIHLSKPGVTSLP